MKFRLAFWPLAVSYMCFLVFGNATYAPQSFVGAIFGALLGVACASVFLRRARRHEQQELARLLTPRNGLY